MNQLTTSILQSSAPSVTPTCLDDGLNPYLQSEAVTSVPWPAMGPDLNPIEHTWDMLCRRIHAREPPVQKNWSTLHWL
jgi:hypothetical protein